MSAEFEVPGITAAIEAAGGQVALAEALGVTQQEVSRWKVRGFVPEHRVVEVEQATGVPRGRLIDPALMELITPPSM